MFPPITNWCQDTGADNGILRKVIKNIAGSGLSFVSAAAVKDESNGLLTRRVDPVAKLANRHAAVGRRSANTMLTTFKRVAKAILLGLVIQQGQAADEADIVDGFTEFLVDRANANLVAIFERRLKDDENFKCYFPNTHAKIEKLRLADLFASKDYWENSLAVDLETLIYRSLFIEAQRGLKLIDRNQIIEALQLFEYVFDGKPYRIDFIEFGTPEPAIQQINGFTENLAKALNGIDKQRIYEDVCDLTVSNKEELQVLLKPYMSAADELTLWAKHLDEYGKNLRLNEEGKRQLVCELKNVDAEQCAQMNFDDSELSEIVRDKYKPEVFLEAGGIARRLEKAFDDLETVEHLGSNEKRSIKRAAEQLPLLEEKGSSATVDVEDFQDRLASAMEETREKSRETLVAILADIKEKFKTVDDADYKRISGKLQAIIDSEKSYTERALVALELLEDSNQFNDAEMDRLRRSVTFFVSIADAEDKDAVKSILEAYTLPAVSYTEKRKQGHGIFISSYLGAGFADSDVHDSEEKGSDGGLFVPVGLEYNYGYPDGHSWSVMLSPIDMAYPVNLKLRGIEEDVEFDELIAPSLAVAYGFEDLPVNAGIAYQKGRQLDDVDKTEEKWLLFVTFDLPLFRLY